MTTKSRFFFYIFILIAFPTLAQKQKIDSLNRMLGSSNNNTKLEILAQLSEIYSDSSLILASQYIKQGLELSKKNHNLASEIEFKLREVRVLFNQAKFKESISQGMTAIDLAEKLKNEHYLALALYGIGSSYKQIGEFNLAQTNLNKALVLQTKNDEKEELAKTLKMIGNTFSKMEGKDKEALLSYSKGLKIAENLKNLHLQSSINNNIGTVYKNLEQYPQALKSFENALNLAIQNGDKYDAAFYKNNIGSLYFDLKNYEMAVKFELEALAIAEKGTDLELLINNYNNLSHTYEKKKEYQKALFFQTKFSKLLTTSLEEQTSRQLNEIQALYTASQKEKEIDLLKKNRKIQLVELEREKAEAKVQRNILWSVAFVLLLFLTFSVFIYRTLQVTKSQKRIIEQRKAEVDQQKQIIEEKNKAIHSSISYAQMIQEAKLPRKSVIYQSLKNAFVLYKPKDVVSGDFYFFYKKLNEVFIAAIDCTGHGIPGAFMSMIGSEKLFESISKSSDVSEILSQMNKGIKTTLRQTDEASTIKDGMDLALCKIVEIEYENKWKVEYAGANRPLLLIRNGNQILTELKATKKAIGGFTENDQHFESHLMELNKGDTFYIFSDGYADGFNKAGKKMTTKKMKEILLEIQHLNMLEQEKFLSNFSDSWIEGSEQIDDILVIGIRV